VPPDAARTRLATPQIIIIYMAYSSSILYKSTFTYLLTSRVHNKGAINEDGMDFLSDLGRRIRYFVEYRIEKQVNPSVYSINTVTEVSLPLVLHAFGTGFHLLRERMTSATDVESGY